MIARDDPRGAFCEALDRAVRPVAAPEPEGRRRRRLEYSFEEKEGACHMVRIGIIGIGFMGTTHFNAAKALKGAKVTAIASRDPAKLKGDWSHITGNLGRRGGVQDLTGIKTYNDYRRLLEDPEIDLVDICLPVELHRPVAVEALEAGKHVLVEKPIAPSLPDANAMIHEAEAQNRRLFVAHVVRFFPEFAYVKEALESGAFGQLKTAHLKRVISIPRWALDGASPDEKWEHGDVVLDLHVHDADFVQFLLGMPDRVFATGVAEAGRYLHVNAHYLFDRQAVAITCQSGALAMEAVSFEQGFDVYFDKATLSFNSRSGHGLTVWRPGDREPFQPQLSGVDPFTAELQYVVDALRGEHDGHLLDARSARNSLLLCERCRESARRGQILHVVPA